MIGVDEVPENLSCDIVIMNPPWGFQSNKADRPLLEYGFNLQPSSLYVIHSANATHLEQLGKANGYDCEIVFESNFRLPPKYTHQSRKMSETEVRCWRFHKPGDAKITTIDDWCIAPIRMGDSKGINPPVNTSEDCATYTGPQLLRKLNNDGEPRHPRNASIHHLRLWGWWRNSRSRRSNFGDNDWKFHNQWWNFVQVVSNLRPSSSNLRPSSSNLRPNLSRAFMKIQSSLGLSVELSDGVPSVNAFLHLMPLPCRGMFPLGAHWVNIEWILSECWVNVDEYIGNPF